MHRELILSFLLPRFRFLSRYLTSSASASGAERKRLDLGLVLPGAQVAELEQELLDSQAEATEYRRKTMALQKQLEEYQDPGFESALRRGGVLELAGTI